MIRNLRRAFVVASWLIIKSAFAATVPFSIGGVASSVPNDYVDLGPGPMLLQVLGNPAIVVQSDTKPASTTTGMVITPLSPPTPFNITSHLWAKSQLGAQGVSTVLVVPTVQTSTVAQTPGATWAQTTDKSCSANVVCTLSSLTVRRYFSVTNTTNNGFCRVAYNGVQPTLTTGDPLAPAQVQNGQGGARTFETYAPPGVILAICSVNSTLAVMEGN